MAVKTILDESSISGGATVTGSSFRTRGAFRCALQGIATGNASCTSDVRIHVRASLDEVDWDTVDVGESNTGNFDVPVSSDAGNETISSAAFNTGYEYIRPVAENLDATYAASNVKVKVLRKEQDTH